MNRTELDACRSRFGVLALSIAGVLVIAACGDDDTGSDAGRDSGGGEADGGTPDSGTSDPDFGPGTTFGTLFSVDSEALGLPSTAVADNQGDPQGFVYSATGRGPTHTAMANQNAVTPADLGLASADDVDALSTLHQTSSYTPIYFSVVDEPGGDEGLAGTGVRDNSENEDDPGDVYHSLGFWNGSAAGRNLLYIDEARLGLQPDPQGGPTKDNLNALDFNYDTPPGAFYFSVAAGSAGSPGSAVEQTPADERACTVFRSEANGENSVAFSCAQLGLAPGDNVDALVVRGSTTVSEIWFSVDDGSSGLPGTAVGTESGLGTQAGDVFRSPGTMQNTLIIPEVALGLQAQDDLDALAVVDLNFIEYLTVVPPWGDDDDLPPFGQQIVNGEKTIYEYPAGFTTMHPCNSMCGGCPAPFGDVDTPSTPPPEAQIRRTQSFSYNPDPVEFELLVGAQSPLSLGGTSPGCPDCVVHSDACQFQSYQIDVRNARPVHLAVTITALNAPRSASSLPQSELIHAYRFRDSARPPYDATQGGFPSCDLFQGATDVAVLRNTPGGREFETSRVEGPNVSPGVLPTCGISTQNFFVTVVADSRSVDLTYGGCADPENPGPEEVCRQGDTSEENDDDCDFSVDEGCPCTEPRGCTRQDRNLGVNETCLNGTQACVDGVYGPCELNPNPATGVDVRQAFFGHQGNRGFRGEEYTLTVHPRTLGELVPATCRSTSN